MRIEFEKEETDRLLSYAYKALTYKERESLERWRELLHFFRKTGAFDELLGLVMKKAYNFKKDPYENVQKEEPLDDFKSEPARPDLESSP